MADAHPFGPSGLAPGAPLAPHPGLDEALLAGYLDFAAADPMRGCNDPGVNFKRKYRGPHGLGDA